MRREASLLLLGVSIYKAVRFISHTLIGNQLVGVDDSFKDDAILPQTISPPVTKYDVFLSFRGEDTRHTFASHLYKELCNVGIHTFMDYKLCKGDQISQVLTKTIEESQISMIIFSQNYASSKWCMDELVHILKCNEKFGRVVIPIFYNVDPSNIRKQNGIFGKGFNVLKQRFQDNKKKVQKWRGALIQSASLCGWDSNSTRPESKLVEEIVKDALSKLNYNSSYHLEGLIGIARHIRNIENLLIEAPIVGIWGMGGVGKTTLANAIFQELRSQFNAFSFIEKVKEKLQNTSLNELQKSFLKEVLKDEGISIYDIKSTSVKNRLGCKKILLVLDDVDNSKIAADLSEVLNWFGEGSRVIITSRDLQVLNKSSAFSTYHLSGLDFHDAIHLFSLKAFNQHEPFDSYLELSELVVKYCQGNPLALVVLGCFLYGREKEEWDSALEKLNQDPPKDIVNVLKLSFDGLDEKQQHVFLDLAFLINEGVHIPLNLRRQLYESSALIDISVLREKSLISFNNHGYIEIHDLVKKMGLKIARQQLISYARTPIRLWRHEDIADFFNRGKGIESIRCLSLDKSKMKRVTVKAKHFQKMHNLIFFKVYNSDWRKPSTLNICGDLNYLPEELRFFIWEEYPLSYVPLHLCVENLVELRMPKSNIRQFGNENQHFPNLKKIELEGSKDLTTLPNLSYAPNIEDLYVGGCVNLGQIHSSTFPSNLRHLFVTDGVPRRINIGGSMEGAMSRLVMGLTYFDVEELSIHEMRMKVLVCGDMICGFKFKHVVMPLEKIVELRKETQSLTSLLPFVRRVDCFKDPIEFGDDDFDPHYPDHFLVFLRLRMKVRGEIVVGPLRRRMINEEEGRCSSKSISLMADDEEEEEEDEELMIKEYRGSNSNAILFTTIPNSIARWSLLTQLRLKESDMNGKEGCSTLKSLIELSHHHHHPATTIQPICLIDFRLSSPDISPSRFRNFFSVRYGSSSLFRYFHICQLMDGEGYDDGFGLFWKP